MSILNRFRSHTINSGTLTANAVRSAKAAGVGVTTLLVTCLSWPLTAQQIALPSNALPTKVQAAVPFSADARTVPSKPGAEGITIHGHWVIDVKNADGSIAEHRDFENALVPSQGGSVLAGLLLGKFSPQTFDVVLAGTGKTALLYLSGQSCPQVLASFQGDCSATLTTDTLGGSTVLLKSNYAPPAALTITTVSTNIGTCPTTSGGATPVSPATCQATTSGTIPGSGGAGVGIYNFTAATIPDLVIAAGQTLTVTVAISFA